MLNEVIWKYFGEFFPKMNIHKNLTCIKRYFQFIFNLQIEQCLLFNLVSYKFLLFRSSNYFNSVTLYEKEYLLCNRNKCCVKRIEKPIN